MVQSPRACSSGEELLQKLDRAVTKRITVISAPPGSGKTSLLRAWFDHSTESRRVAFVSVDRDEQDAQRFWSAVLDALRSQAASIDPAMQPSASAGVDGEQLVDMVRSELAELREPVVLIVDDLHELRSAEALGQLARLLAALPNSARVVLSSRRDPPLRLHQLGFPTRSSKSGPAICGLPRARRANCWPRPGSACPTQVRPRCYRRTEGWAAGLRLAVISLTRHPGSRAFRGRVLRHRQGDRRVPDGGDARRPTERRCRACCCERRLSTG